MVSSLDTPDLPDGWKRFVHMTYTDKIPSILEHGLSYQKEHGFVTIDYPNILRTCILCHSKEDADELLIKTNHKRKSLTDNHRFTFQPGTSAVIIDMPEALAETFIDKRTVFEKKYDIVSPGLVPPSYIRCVVAGGTLEVSNIQPPAATYTGRFPLKLTPNIER